MRSGSWLRLFRLRKAFDTSEKRLVSWFWKIALSIVKVIFESKIQSRVRFTFFGTCCPKVLLKARLKFSLQKCLCSIIAALIGIASDFPNRRRLPLLCPYCLANERESHLLFGLFFIFYCFAGLISNTFKAFSVAILIDSFLQIASIFK